MRGRRRQFLLLPHDTVHHAGGGLRAAVAEGLRRTSRKTDGYLPTAHVAFLDEIFKSSSSILNSFLTILNERKFHNGRETIDVPLITAFGASNELPDDEDNLEALYDRFLLRCVVSPIQEEENFREMLFEDNRPARSSVRLAVDQLLAVQDIARSVSIDDDVQRILGAGKAGQRTSVPTAGKKMVNVLRGGDGCRRL
jgi:MoxR-like ATPase